jgi:hypothetical protein
MRLTRIVQACALSLLPIACGRTPVFEGPELFVQVVDEASDGVRRADVELRGDDDARIVDRARTDSHGIAVFDFPGAGRYQLRAHTDLICCFHEGELAATLRGSDEWLVVETRTGP